MHRHDAMPPFHMDPGMWVEAWLFWLLVLGMVVLIAHRMIRRGPRQRRVLPVSLKCRLILPELQLLRLAIPLELFWEIAQFPLYNIWYQHQWSYVLYGLAHCTLGDLLILLTAFELVALLAGGRTWFRRYPVAGALLFTLLGMAYTVYSETVNVRLKGTWDYTDLMPVVPLLNIGGTPFLQWLLLPPVLIWLLRQLPGDEMSHAAG